MGTDLSDGKGNLLQCESLPRCPPQGCNWGGGGGGDFPQLPQGWPLATFIGNKRKIEPKET